MIYVRVEGEMSEGRGWASGYGWHHTDDIAEAISFELARFHRTYQELGHDAAVVTYRITVAPEASPVRTTRQRWPLPVEERA